MARKLDAFRSEKLQTLARNILIVEARSGDAAVIASLLRALLGRHVEARLVTWPADLASVLAKLPPNLVIWRLASSSRRMGVQAFAESIEPPARDIIGTIRATGYRGPVVLVVDAEAEVARLGNVGAVDVIDADQLDSVRLSYALLKAAEMGVSVPNRRNKRK